MQATAICCGHFGSRRRPCCLSSVRLRWCPARVPPLRNQVGYCCFYWLFSCLPASSLARHVTQCCRLGDTEMSLPRPLEVAGDTSVCTLWSQSSILSLYSWDGRPGILSPLARGIPVAVLLCRAVGSVRRCNLSHHCTW